MGPGTGVWLESLYMFVLGTGIGLCMQVLTIAVQNTVDYADLGTATSGVTFFRTLGSSFGTAVFGTIYSNALKPNLTDGITAAAKTGTVPPAVIAKAATSPEGLHRLPPAAASPIIDAYADTIQTVFLWTVPVAAVGFVVSLFLKQVELRDSARKGSTDMGEGFASPHGANSQRLLEAAVGKIIGGTDLDTARRIMAESDTRLDIAGAWAVMQVELYTRLVGHAGLGLIAARRHLPPEVLLPVFDRMVQEGYLTRDGYLLSHTAAGEREAAVISQSWGKWLEARVQQDIGRPAGTDLRAAVDTISKRLLVEDLTNGVPQQPTELAPGASLERQ